MELDERLLQPAHPSETPARRCLRTLAWGLFHRPGLRFNADSVCRPEIPDLEAFGTPERPPLAVAVGGVTVRRLRGLPREAELAVLVASAAAARELGAALATDLAARTRVLGLAPGLPAEWRETFPAGGWRVVESGGRLYVYVGGGHRELDVVAV